MRGWGWLLLGGALLAGGARAEAPWRLTPELKLGLSWTDNADTASLSKRSDTILKYAPGVSLSGRSGESFVTLHTAWDGEAHFEDKSLNRGTLLGNGSGTLDLYEHRVLLDGALNMSRQSLSLLGAPPQNASYDPANQAVVRSYSLSPYARWQWGPDITGLARYRLDSSNSSSAQSGNTTTHNLTVDVGNGSHPAPLGWQALFEQSTSSQSHVADSRSSVLHVNGVYAIDPLFLARVTTGYEHNNYQISEKNTDLIFGGGFDWTPSPRTRLHSQVERRFFGTSADFELNWRGPRSALSARFSRDVTSSNSTLDAQGLVGLYETYVNSLAAIYTNPDELRQRANALWVARGLPTTFGSSTLYQTRSIYLQRRFELSLSENGVRHSAGVTVHVGKNQRLVDPVLLAPTDDFSHFAATRDDGADMFFTYQLSPLTSLSFTAGLSRASGDADSTTPTTATTDAGATRRRNYGLNATTPVGPHMMSNLSYRHDESRGATSYSANTVTADLGVSF